MTLAQLTYFIKVAEIGHLTQAARELLIAQPSLTQSIHKLEGELQFPLFEKTGRALSLTREGKLFLPYAEKVVRAEQDALRMATLIARENSGHIRFAYTEPTPKGYISGLLNGFLQQEENRNANIETLVIGTPRILAALRNDEFDFGICSQSNDATEDFIFYPVLRYPIVAIAAKDHPLCSLDHVELSDLQKYPCISYISNSAMERQLESFWAKHNISPDICHRSTAGAISELVSQGLGWAFVALTGNTLTEDVTILKFPELKMARVMYFAMRANRKHGAAAERFRQYVISYSENFKLP